MNFIQCSEAQLPERCEVGEIHIVHVTKTRWMILREGRRLVTDRIIPGDVRVWLMAVTDWQSEDGSGGLFPEVGKAGVLRLLQSVWRREYLPVVTGRTVPYGIAICEDVRALFDFQADDFRALGVARAYLVDRWINKKPNGVLDL